MRRLLASAIRTSSPGVIHGCRVAVALVSNVCLRTARFGFAGRRPRRGMQPKERRPPSECRGFIGEGKFAGTRLLRQAGRAYSSGRGVSTLLFGGVVGRRAQRAGAVEEVSACRIDGRVQHRLAGLDPHQRDAGRQATDRLRGRYARDRRGHEARGCRYPHRGPYRVESGPVQRVLHAQRCADVFGSEGRPSMARWQDGRRAERQLHGPLRPGGVRQTEDHARGLPEPKHRAHHERVSRQQTRRRGRLGADRFAARRRGARPARRDRQRRGRGRRRVHRRTCRPHRAASGRHFGMAPGGARCRDLSRRGVD